MLSFVLFLLTIALAVATVAAVAYAGLFSNYHRAYGAKADWTWTLVAGGLALLAKLFGY